MERLKDILSKLEGWTLPSWMVSLSEKEINRCIACKLDGKPNDIGVPDIEVDSVGIEAKRNLLSQEDYNSLKGELERVPRRLSSFVLVYGDARKDLLDRLGEVPVKVLGKVVAFREERMETTLGDSPKDFGSYLKDMLLTKGFEEVSNSSFSYDSIVVLKVPTKVKGLGFFFKVYRDKVMVGLGTNSRDSSLRRLLKSWKDKIGDSRYFQDTPSACGLNWVRESRGSRKDKKDWDSLAYILVSLYEEAGRDSLPLVQGEG